MRDAIVGLAGMLVGGALGVGTLAAVEVVGILVLAVFFLSTPQDAPMVAAPSEIAAHAPARAPKARAPSAEPGEVQLLTIALARVLLDGQPMAFDGAVGAYTASVAPGDHRLQILEMLGTGVKAEALVTVSSGRRSQLRYAKGQIIDQGTMPISGLPSSAAAASISLSAPIQEEENPAMRIIDEVLSTNAAITNEILEEQFGSAADGGGGAPKADSGKATLNIGGASLDVKLPKLGRR